MGDVTTSGSTTTPNSKQVTKTGDLLLKGLQSTYKDGVDVYNKPLYTAPSSTTTSAWNAGTAFGNSVIGANGFGAGQQEAQNGVAGLADTYGGLATAYDPNSAAYQTLRSKLADDTLTGVASLGASNGRYGSRSFNEGAAEGLGTALAGLDYGNMQADIANRYRAADSQRGVFGDQFAMGQTALGNEQNAVGLLGQIGASKDADSLAKRMADADLFDKKKNADWEALARASSILGGTAGASGSTTSNSVPWWAALLGGAATVGSIL